MTTITVTNVGVARIVNVIVDPADVDHPPPTLSASGGDLIQWQPKAGSTDGVFIIQEIQQVDFLGRPADPSAPAFPFPAAQKALLGQNAQGVHWGPAVQQAAGHAYKYTIQVGSQTVDPHIVIGP